MPGMVAGTTTAYGYVRLKVHGIKHMAHRLAWLYVMGSWPKGEVDHINSNRADNRIDNLRVVTRSENMQNQRRGHNNRPLPLGVRAKGSSFTADIKVNGLRTHLGTFNSVAEAAAAYSVAKKLLRITAQQRTGTVTSSGSLIIENRKHNEHHQSLQRKSAHRLAAQHS